MKISVTGYTDVKPVTGDAPPAYPPFSTTFELNLYAPVSLASAQTVLYFHPDNQWILDVNNGMFPLPSICSSVLPRLHYPFLDVFGVALVLKVHQFYIDLFCWDKTNGGTRK